jgi:putative FmdB family regulatory protein
MPIYEYECQKCGTRLERLIRRPDDVPKSCPECGGKVRKALSAFSVSMAPSHEPSPSRCASCPSGACPYSGAGG